MMKILVIEDDALVRATLCDMLELMGHDVIQAEDALVGWTKISHDLHLIISDLGLPGMDGLDFLAKLRQDKEFGDLPFIVLTARADRESMNRAKLLGADDYLFKPFTSKTVMVALEKIQDLFWPEETPGQESRPKSGQEESIPGWDEVVREAIKDLKTCAGWPGFSV